MSIPICLCLTGELKEDALTLALRDFVVRHEPLRTNFLQDGDSLFQVASDDFASLKTTNLEHFAPVEKRHRLSVLLVEGGSTPFTLGEEAILRLHLIRFAWNQHLLIFNVHHIAFDGWSMAILFDELPELYGARMAAHSPQLEPLSLHYSDWAKRQSIRQHEGGFERGLNHWVKVLAGAPADTTFPGDRSRDGNNRREGSVCWTVLSDFVMDGLRRACATFRATPFMVLLGAFFCLLHRRSGRDDLVIGCPYANRIDMGVEQLVGFFVNPVAFRIRLSPSDSFAELVKRVRRLTLDAYAHQDTPFGLVADRVCPSPSMGMSPVFQVMFILQNEVIPPPNLGSVKMHQTMLATGFSKYDLTVSIERRGPTFAIDIEYDTSLYEPETAARLLTDYAELIAALIEVPDVPLGQIHIGSLPNTVVRAQDRLGSSMPIESLFEGPVLNIGAG